MSKFSDILYGIAKVEAMCSVVKTSPLQMYKLYRDYKTIKEETYFKSLNIEDIKGNLDWANAKEVA